MTTSSSVSTSAIVSIELRIIVITLPIILPIRSAGRDVMNVFIASPNLEMNLSHSPFSTISAIISTKPVTNLPICSPSKAPSNFSINPFSAVITLSVACLIGAKKSLISRPENHALICSAINSPVRLYSPDFQSSLIRLNIPETPLSIVTYSTLKLNSSVLSLFSCRIFSSSKPPITCFCALLTSSSVSL